MKKYIILVALILIFNLMDSKNCGMVNNITVNNGNVIINGCHGNHIIPCIDKEPFYNANLYDSCGAIHNTLIEKMRICTNEKKEKEHPEEIDLKWCFDVSSDVLEQLWAFKRKPFFNNTKSLIDDADNGFVNYISTLTLDSENKSMLIKLFNELKGISENEIDDYSEWKKVIIKYENDILKKDNLFDNEVAIVLSSLSVLRFSLFYWHDNINEDSSSAVMAKKEKGKVWKKIVMGLADAAGAIGGGVTGAAAGSLALPGAGTVIGAVSGAITGATAASNAVATLWNNYKK